MGISNLFDIASSGITAQRLAIEVTGENIANVSTEGYSRQQVVMDNRPVNISNGFALGTGVEIQTVRRSYDAMLQEQIIDSDSTYQQNLARQNALSQIEPFFNELNADGLGKAMDDFFGAWQDLSTNAGGIPERQALLTRSRILVDTFHQINTSLTSVAQSADTKLSSIASEVSDLARDLAQINAQIEANQTVQGNPNELLDRRDLLLRQMAERVAITSTFASDGTVTVSAGGEDLVNGTDYATLYANSNGTNNDILITAVGNPPPGKNAASDTNVTTTIGGTGNTLGEMGGTLQVRDSIVPGYLASLDEMADKLVSAVNTVHAAGYGTDGSTGNSFFNAGGTTSATIALDPGLTAARIAAALPSASDPAPPGSGNNLNALKLVEIQGSTVAFSTGNATFGSFYNALSAKVGSDTQGAKNSTAQGAAFLNQLDLLRNSHSAVSLDEELTNLTRYQQAFQGSARVLNVATSMVDTILGLVQ